MRKKQSSPGAPRARTLRSSVPLLAALTAAAAGAFPARSGAQSCARTITADVVALDQPVIYNRLGAWDPGGMLYALRSDVVAKDGGTPGPGNARLRADKRPRPMVLRANVGDCLQITFTNWLAATPVDHEQPATRSASVHVQGMQPAGGIGDDGSHVGKNASSLAAPGETRTYKLYAQREGAYFLYNAGSTVGGEGDGGSITRGMFGAVNVEPRDAEWYRSQMTATDLQLATARNADGTPRTTPTGQPVIDYGARYPEGHPRAGTPIVAMLDGTRIVATDLNAVITGRNRGSWAPGTFPAVRVEPNRERPFREFTVVFHDETGIVQAFPEFDDPQFEHTLHGGRDAFAINYGSAGAGAEVLANRRGVGPMAKCNECKLEEFFLSSWAVGDPAMIVDVPANAGGGRATKAIYPDDPSNVHHSYLGDRVKIRNVHAGPKEHHIFHLHAHQWLRTPDSDNSTYLDSQGVGPGSAFTYEIAHGGSGNRNYMPGDAVLHCHFYPHFAQGMWGLWRTHDVFEAGTALDASGMPVAGARTLPDGEIAAGTPIPAVVPIPGGPLPVMPGTLGNPGFPFYIAGEPGHRAPKPPLGTAFDGGLPRHVVTGGTAEFPALNPRDFEKRNVTLQARALAEGGTELERAAMRFHASRTHATSTVDPNTLAVTSSSFTTNGRAPVAGAPFADPCVADDGSAVGTPRTYKAAAFQLDVKYNKAGWHFPQHRMFSLWEDVNATISGSRTPEPLFFRANTNDCIEYRLVNLLPNVYELDDFQVRSPTDVIGQHIHLVKFDVTASDGAANGFNYESGALSPDEVRERIDAIRRQNGCAAGDVRDNTFACPLAKPHPFFGPGANNRWVGAQEFIERWFTDDVLNAAGQDRTLRTVFTHDHFGPSTHQQAGLYAGLVGEPRGSVWRDPETGARFGTRADGGPTSWRADILTSNSADAYREFNLMTQDFALAYRAGNGGFPAPAFAINPPGRREVGLPKLLAPPDQCPNGSSPPCPEIVSSDDVGTMTVNYRNEPLALRVRDPATNRQATGTAGDLSYAFSSSVTRADPAFRTQPSFYKPLTGGVLAGDPFTPLLRAYENDKVSIRLMVGGHEEMHNFTMHGARWLTEPSWSESGWKNGQLMGLSEHFEFVLPPLPGNTRSNHADYLYKAGASTDDLWNGLWGILRAYRSSQKDLQAMPNNPNGGVRLSNGGDFNGVCPKSAPVRALDVSAVLASQALPGGTLTFHAPGGLHDPTAIVYVRSEDLDAAGKLRAGVPVEPYIARVRAGECIAVTLRNRLPNTTMPDLDGYNSLPMIVNDFNANDVRPSNRVGLHPQLLAYDVTRDDGAEVGSNNASTAAPGGTITYRWYAGLLEVQSDGRLVATPAEFGATNLVSSDPIKHGNKSAVGTLIVEPANATWSEDAKSRAIAVVNHTDDAGAAQQFHEFVLVLQNDVNMRQGSGDGSPVPSIPDEGDSEDAGQKAFNYRTEPLWLRMGHAADTPLEITRTFDFSNVLSNAKVGGADPQTPVFEVQAGKQVRFRVLHPAGHQRNSVFAIHGHGWQELPYRNRSTSLGRNPNSEWRGSVYGLGPSAHFDLLLEHGAGGAFSVPGDYLFRDMMSFQQDGGLWGILRVLPK